MSDGFLVFPAGTNQDYGQHTAPSPTVSAGATQGDIWRAQIVRVASIVTGGAHHTHGLPTVSFSTGGALGTGTWPSGMPRAVQTTTTVAGNSNSVSWGSPSWLYTGNAAHTGGFRVEFVAGLETAVATTRWACGIAAAAPNLITDPSAQLNCIMVASDAADTQYQVMQNDGVGACTKTALGVGFPASTAAVWMRIVLQCDPNGSQVNYTVTRLDDTTVVPVTGSINSNLPSNTTKMTPFVAIGNGSTAASAGIGFIRLLIEETEPQ